MPAAPAGAAASQPEPETRGARALAPKILAKTSLHSRAATWATLWEADPDLPARLKAAGIDGMEVAVRMSGDLEADAEEAAQLLEWAGPWHAAGLVVYAHPYTRGPANPAAYRPGSADAPHDSFRIMAQAAARLAERSGAPALLTYHAAEAREIKPADRQELLSRSVAFFAAADAYLEELGAPVTAVSETQLPYELDRPHARIADRPQEVLATVAGLSRVHICWDTGHYLLAVERVGVPPTPPPAFAARVVHLHVHDVTDGVDHRPITADSRQVARYVAQAARQGRVGSITLEYDPARAFAAEYPPAADLLRHFAAASALVRRWARG